MRVWFYAMVSVLVVSAISLIGIFFLTFDRDRLRKLLFYLISFAVGGLFGDAFIHLIPEAYRELGINPKTSLLIVFGILLFFILEKFIRWRHCHIPVSSTHLHPVVMMNLVGDGVHNLIDGVLIGASYMVDPTIGITTTIAVVLHEIPQEIGDFGVLLYGGLSVKKAVIYNLLSASCAFLGAIIALSVGVFSLDYLYYVLPVTAGGFIYIAGSDLIPELNDETANAHESCQPSKAIGQLMAISLGIGVMILLTLLE